MRKAKFWRGQNVWGVGFGQARFLVLCLGVTKLPLSESVPYFDSKFVGAGRRINPSPEGREHRHPVIKRSAVFLPVTMGGSDEPSKSFR
jgi:hypothetical protein